MTKDRKILDVVTIGFALFSMFFGAGNVIFPPYLGLQSGHQWLGGFFAYYFADVLLALLAPVSYTHLTLPTRDQV